MAASVAVIRFFGGQVSVMTAGLDAERAVLLADQGGVAPDGGSFQFGGGSDLQLCTSALPL